MRKLYRGEVIIVSYPDGKDANGEKKYKPRHVVVKEDCPKNSDVITVYCTTKNNDDDKNNIFVPLDSEEGENMGLTADTYIRPKVILTLPTESIKRPVGRCSLMQDITKIIDDNMAK
jgi:hypothetical protein